MKYRECPYCHAALDPCEICDCQEAEKSEAPTAATDETSRGVLESTNSVTHPSTDVNALLRLAEIRQASGVQAKEMANVVRQRFPKFNRQLFAECEHPDRYGIVIHPDGLSLICKAYGIKTSGEIKVTKRVPNRTKPVHLSLRMTDEDYLRLSARVQADGYASVQAWLYDQIINILEAN